MGPIKVFLRSTKFLNLLTCLAIAMRYILDENLMKMDPDLGVYQPAYSHSFVVFCLYSANTLQEIRPAFCRSRERFNCKLAMSSTGACDTEKKCENFFFV